MEYPICDTFYSFDRLRDYLSAIVANVHVETSKKRWITYLEVPAAFDIETSSFMCGGEKCACMYMWQFGFGGYDIYGRTWKEFVTLLESLKEIYELDDKRRLIIGVHNLSYEFQFMKLWFTWDKVFAMSPRKVLNTTTDLGFEFRCTYLLTGKSLENVGKSLHNPLPKLVGSVDYDLVRHSRTPLEAETLDYGKRDVDIIQALFWDKMEDEGNLSAMPLTKTGYCRQYFREKCLYIEPAGRRKKRGLNKKYRELISELTISPEEFSYTKDAFWGGFTHGSCFHINQKVKNCGGFDFTSSYPATICELFPMGLAFSCEEMDFTEWLDNIGEYYSIATFTLTNVHERILFEHYISESKCLPGSIVNTVDNGRVVDADKIIITCTDIDFEIISKFYTFDPDVKVERAYFYYKKYLPKEFIEAWLDLYADKTTLKGVEGMEREYMLKKENCNAGYGMCVTNPLQDEYGFDGRYIKPCSQNIEAAMEKYNKDRKRFLYYIWGIFITAFARRNLIYGMMFPFGGLDREGNQVARCDYLYADTDSNKVRNPEEHFEQMEQYNREYEVKLKIMLDYHKIPYEKAFPKDIHGNVHPIGFIDFEGYYDEFKALGAKRYMYKDKKGYHLTIAGVPKIGGVDSIVRQADEKGVDPFEVFDMKTLKIPKEDINKLTMSYENDAPCHGYVTDYMGNVGEFHEHSFVHAEKVGYDIQTSQDFVDYIEGIAYSVGDVDYLV